VAHHVTQRGNRRQETVSGPGIIRFYWKVSSQLGSDYLEFFIDSVRQTRISGTTDWQGQSYTITGSGTHTLRRALRWYR
jgi:hypothetical protein